MIFICSFRYKRLQSSPEHSRGHPDKLYPRRRDRGKYTRSHTTPLRENRKNKTSRTRTTTLYGRSVGKNVYKYSPSHSTHDGIDKRHTNSHENGHRKPYSDDSEGLNNSDESYHENNSHYPELRSLNTKESNQKTKVKCDSSDRKYRRRRRSSSKESTVDSFNSRNSGQLSNKSFDMKNETMSEQCNANKRKRMHSGSHSDDSSPEDKRSDKRTKFISERENRNRLNGKHMADNKCLSSDLFQTSERSNTHTRESSER